MHGPQLVHLLLGLVRLLPALLAQLLRPLRPLGQLPAQHLLGALHLARVVAPLRERVALLGVARHLLLLLAQLSRDLVQNLDARRHVR